MERPTPPGVAGQQVDEWLSDRLGEGIRDADRKRHTERVTDPRRVLDREPALLTGDPYSNGAASLLKLREHDRRRSTLKQLISAQVAEHA